jgi:hypothetical protein
MDPKELATLHAKKKAATAAETAKSKIAAEKQQEEFRKRVEQGRAAMRDVVIPYFKELVSAFPKGQFKFNPGVTVEAETLAPVAVAFKIGDGAEHTIEVNQGNVTISKKGPQYPAKTIRPGVRSPGMNIRFVFAGTADPFIAGPSDLTREKLSKLVEMAIKEA